MSNKLERVNSVSYIISNKGEQSLEDFCSFPNKPMQILKAFLATQGIDKTFEELRREISEDFERSLSDSTCCTSDVKAVFPIRYTQDSEPILITLRRSDYDSPPLFVYFVQLKSEVEVVQPHHAFECFAFLKSWTSYLEALAAKVAPEVWDFKDDRAYSILCQYIKYTFYRLSREHKIMVAKDESFAAFNTGLVDSKYNDVYACFVPNDDKESKTPWVAAGFCTAAARGLGKTLVDKFSPLPSPATYFSTFSDIFFDVNKPVLVDYEHIISDRLDRLPPAFIRSCLPGNTKVADLVDKYERAETDSERQECALELRGTIVASDDLFMCVQNHLDIALKETLKMASHDYHVAVPSYSPRADKTVILLPLFLTKEDAPDVALVVGHTDSGNYQGHTILTLQQAYVDARLICSLSANWLTSCI